MIDYHNIFWDFDGVIKDSVAVKSDAFEQLFLPFGKNMVKKIRKHHEVNSGMSRFDKLPLYLEWAGEKVSQNLVNEFSEKFSLLAKDKVISSKWIDGVLDYLKNNHKKQRFFLITATPQQEIEEILAQLKIADYFKQVSGSPINKNLAIQILLKRYNIDQQQAVMIGDSNSDYEAATSNKINFILKKTYLNQKLQTQLHCPMITNFK